MKKAMGKMKGKAETKTNPPESGTVVDDEDRTDYFHQIVPFGYHDVDAAIKVAKETGHDANWAGEQVTEYLANVGGKLEDIDPICVVFDSLLQEARNDIDTATGVDILNDTKEQIEVYGNYVCTTLDYSEKAKEEALAIIAKVKDEDTTDAIRWLKRQLE